MSSMLTTVRSIWRFHRLLAGILVLEYAVTFAITMSAVSIAHARAQAFAFESGIDETGLYVVRPQPLRGGMRPSDVSDAADVLRASAADVAVGSAVPFLGAGDESGSVGKDDNAKVRATIYHGGTNFLSTLGSRMIRGRSFLSDEVLRSSSGDSVASVVILSETLAERLFHNQSPLGQTVFLNGSALVVVGVCAPLAGPQFRGRPETTYTLILPGAPVSPTGAVIVVRSHRADALLSHLIGQLNAATSGRIHWTMQPYALIRANYFKADRAIAMGLSVTVLAVLLTSLCGVLGLTRYWIGRRQTQIAVRRALGAKRIDIVRHFLLESVWLVVCGLAVGCVVAIMASHWTGLFYGGGLDTTSLAVSLVITFGLSVVAVYVSLYRLVRLQPIELARSAGG